MKNIFGFILAIMLFQGCSSSSSSSVSDTNEKTSSDTNISQLENENKDDGENPPSPPSKYTDDTESVPSLDDDKSEKNNSVADSNGSTNSENKGGNGSGATPPSIPSEYQNGKDEIPEINSTKTVMNSISSNELIFGTTTANFSSGDLGTISYLASDVSEDIFNISFAFENVENSTISILLRIKDTNSSRLLIVVLNNLEVKNGELNSNSAKDIYLYGIRSNETPLSLISKIEENSSVLSSKNGKISINFNEVLKGVDTAPSLGSYLTVGTKLELIFAIANISDLADGKDVYSEMSTNLAGEIKSNLENKMVEDKTFGISGIIEIN